MSKAGRTALRWIMIEVAWAHVAANGPEAERYHRLVTKGKPKGVAIAALARHLLVLAYYLLTHKEPYRRLETEKFEDKLQRLAAYRPITGGLEPTHREWAADRLETLTGFPSPHRQAQPHGRPLRRRNGYRKTDPLKEVTQVIARAVAVAG